MIAAITTTTAILVGMSLSPIHADMTRRYAAQTWSIASLQDAFYRAIKQESQDFDPDVVFCRRSSPAGAKGIAQLMPSAHPTVDPCDPSAALAYAANWIAQMINQSDLRTAYASYNAGPGRVAQLKRDYGVYWEFYLPDETKQYLAIVDIQPLYYNAQSKLEHPTATYTNLEQEFGWTEFAKRNPNIYGPLGHTGYDFANAPVGTLNLSTVNGLVQYAGWRNVNGDPIDDGTGYGVCAIIRADDKTTHYYAHNALVNVSAGTRVTRGSILGQLGFTGKVVPKSEQGAHLHYEVRNQNNTPFDPRPYLVPQQPQPQPIDYHAQLEAELKGIIAAANEDAMRAAVRIERAKQALSKLAS